MALPTPERTYHIRANNRITTTSRLNKHRALLNGYVKAMMDIDKVGGGSTSSFAFSASVITLTDTASLFESGDVGKTIRVRGSTTAGNNGDFVIVSFIDADNITYSNSSGATETMPTASGWMLRGGNVTTPWECEYSCDSITVSADNDGVYMMNTDGDYKWSTGARSWVVLSNATLGLEILVACRYSSEMQLAVNVSDVSEVGQLAGGTTTTDPLSPGGATDGTRNVTNYWAGNDTSSPLNPNWIFHTWLADDGSSFRATHSKDGVFPAMWITEDTIKFAAGDSNNVLHGVSSTNGPTNSNFDPAELENTDKYITTSDLRAPAWSATVAVGLTYNNNRIMNALATVDGTLGEFYMYPVPLFDPLEPGGPVGTWRDCWWAQTLAHGNGDTFPADSANRDFVVINSLVWPWTGDSTQMEIA